MQRPVWLLALFAFAASAGAAAPSPGRYAATFCVATSLAQPPSCGPAELDVHSASHADVRMSDIVYRLTLRPSQVDVTTLQERMLIDGFSAAYDWSGPVLRFVDAAKGVHYEVRTGRRLPSRQ